MRDYGTIHNQFWTSDTIRALSDDGRMLAVYCLTNPHANIIGCFRLADGYVCDDLGWTVERVVKGFAELFDNGFATRDDKSKWCIVKKYLLWNRLENPNQIKAAIKAYASVPAKSGVKGVLAECIIENEPRFPVEKLNGYETLPQPYRNQEQEQEQQQEQEQKPLSSSSQKKNGVAVLHDAPQADAMTVQQVFGYWQKVMRSPRSSLDDKRRKVIKRALALYSPADVCRAVRGCSRSPWHMGTNPKRTKFNGLELILRDAEKIDAFIAMDESPPAADLYSGMTVQQRNDAISDANIADWLNEGKRDDGRTIDMEH